MAAKRLVFGFVLRQTSTHLRPSLAGLAGKPATGDGVDLILQFIADAPDQKARRRGIRFSSQRLQFNASDLMWAKKCERAAFLGWREARSCCERQPPFEKRNGVRARILLPAPRFPKDQSVSRCRNLQKSGTSTTRSKRAGANLLSALAK